MYLCVFLLWSSLNFTIELHLLKSEQTFKYSWARNTQSLEGTEYSSLLSLGIKETLEQQKEEEGPDI